jgi:subtilase family serine protease
VNRSASRLAAVAATLLLAATGIAVATAPASALPNCNVPTPPPICGGVDPVEKLPDLTTAVTGPASATGGTAAAYTVRVSNLSSTAGAVARGVAVRITAGGGATISSAALAGWSCTASGATATCSGGSLGVGAGASIPVTVQLPPATTSVVVAATADPNGAIVERSESNNSAAFSTAVTAPALPDLQATMSGPSAVRGLYAAGVWTITVRNIGSAAATPVNVRWLTNWGGSVNANAVISGAIGFSCIVPPEYVQQMVYCYGTAPLQPGASATIVLTAVPPAPGDVYGAAGVSSVTATVDYSQQVAESNESNNAATVVSALLP